MKQVTAIVRPEVLEPLKDALTEAGVSGMTIFEVQGCGHQHGWKEYVRGSEVLLTMVPKVEVMLVVDDDEVDPLIERGAHPYRRARPGSAVSGLLPHGPAFPAGK